MRVTEERIQLLATEVVDRLQEKGLLEVSGSKERLIRGVGKAITDELSVEDRLHAEIRTLLKQYDTEFQSGRADYQKMFTMVKTKLVKERGLVL
ncbi:MAG: DUF507 family protein [Nitrospira sp. SB0677_bin_15]|nr:DUF507 family protein [Nitrospira sp. SB0667_bin_9]MYD32142.1 DUF507 family protein [Nitrospira sp. SB0661_bin_20]MYG39572.1 DUF507 family protein [Nitrospira sp. SB0677_bin_15]MYH02054.1 DUF507 family protein [Nitrospira sp. SB0675_bin_23]MYJ22608.1 DUF507 family protein [Nitrospira sp. SB0673_bin_12]